MQRYRPPQPKHEPEVETPHEPEGEGADYRAFYRPNVPTSRLRFVLKGGESWAVPYTQIVLTRFLPPDVLAVHTHTHLFMIEGRELERLDAMLADEECAVIVVHDEAAHGPAPDSGALVETVTVQGPEAANVNDAGTA